MSMFLRRVCVDLLYMCVCVLCVVCVWMDLCICVRNVRFSDYVCEYAYMRMCVGVCIYRYVCGCTYVHICICLRVYV